MTRTKKHFAIVTFGSPAVRIARYTNDLDAARLAACRAKGSGSCSEARVYECDTRALARSADISAIRSGEIVVFRA